jgi:predicted metal-dependent hydrolase
MAEIMLEGTAIPYTVERSSRKSIAAHITAEGTILIKAPRLIPEFLLRRFLHQKRSWILDRLRRREEFHSNNLGLRYDNGDMIHFFDKLMPIIVTETDLAKVARVYRVDNTFQVMLPPGLSAKTRRDETRRVLHEWYLRNVKPVLEERVRRYAATMGLTYDTIRVKDVSSHWGSCSTNRNMNFNYRLGMLPVDLADYVIVHELCHLLEMNHSRRFWDHVARFVPDYRAKRARLKEYHAILE